MVTIRKRHQADLKLRSIEFRTKQYGEDVLVGQMSRFDGERNWRIYFRGEFQGTESKSVAYEWLEARARKMTVA